MSILDNSKVLIIELLQASAPYIGYLYLLDCIENYRTFPGQPLQLLSLSSALRVDERCLGPIPREILYVDEKENLELFLTKNPTRLEIGTLKNGLNEERTIIIGHTPPKVSIFKSIDDHLLLVGGRMGDNFHVLGVYGDAGKENELSVFLEGVEIYLSNSRCRQISYQITYSYLPLSLRHEFGELLQMKYKPVASYQRLSDRKEVIFLQKFIDKNQNVEPSIIVEALSDTNFPTQKNDILVEEEENLSFLSDRGSKREPQIFPKVFVS